jgi:hypothetical protein
LGGSKATSDCFYCSEGKVLSAFFGDYIGRCVDFVDYNSCEVGYRIDNGLDSCDECEEGYSF